MGLKKSEKNLAIGALVAASVGYIAGILTAPKSGRETRGDIAKSASKAKTEGEKQLKKLHSELSDLLKKADAQKTKLGTKAGKELKQAVDKAVVAKDKARLLLSALHEGDADDPNLKAVIKEVKKAKSELGKFLKK